MSEQRRQKYPKNVLADIDKLYNSMSETLGNPKSDVVEEVEFRAQLAGYGYSVTVGYCKHFEHGAIYWCEQNGAQPLYGEIAVFYEASNGLGKDGIGFPSTDQTPATASPYGTKGLYQHFVGASINTIYWCEKYGAHLVKGLIRTYHEEHSGTGGKLGFPVAVEQRAKSRNSAGFYQKFEGGWVYSCLKLNRDGHSCSTRIDTVVSAAIATLYQELKGAEGVLGFPIGEQTKSQDTPQIYQQQFEGGRIIQLGNKAIAFTGEFLGYSN